MRDLVFESLGCYCRSCGFRDVDIALLTTLADSYNGSGLGSARQNRYGGRKYCLPSGLLVDVWRWDAPRVFPSRTMGWCDWLERIDFDVNAVAFIWPERRIVFHPAWERAMIEQRIAPLTRCPLDWRRDVLRGCASR